MGKNVAAIICAAGASSRFGGGRKKPFVDVAGRAALLRSVELFSNRDDVKQIFLAIAVDDEELVNVKWGPNLKFFNVKIFIGGTERFDTVQKGLELIKDDIDLIAVHDAVRCCVKSGWVDECLTTAPFNITSPAKTEFTDFIGANYRAVPPRAIYKGDVTLGKTLETTFPEYLKTATFPAFGYIGNLNFEHWQVVVEAEFRDTPQAVLLAAVDGKGRVALSTLFLDHDVAVAKNEAAKNVYIELLKWITRAE